MVKSLASNTIILFLTHVTWTYQVEFLDGQVGEYNANTIAWNMLSQCNPNGNQYTLMESIVDLKRDGTALTKSQSTFKYKGK